MNTLIIISQSFSPFNKNIVRKIVEDVNFQGDNEQQVLSLR